MTQSLAEVAQAMVAPGKGILAADESHGTIGKRFAAIVGRQRRFGRLFETRHREPSVRIGTRCRVEDRDRCLNLIKAKGVQGMRRPGSQLIS